LDYENLTGEENVSVINRETGKKITGAKAPPLKYLAAWLEQNPGFDIDPKWGPLVKSKGELPDRLQHRIQMPSGRGRGRGSPAYKSSSVVGGEYSGYPSVAALSAMGGLNPASLMAAGFPKMAMGMPFGGVPGLGMANPYVQSLASFGMIPGMSAKSSAGGDDDSEGKTKDDEGSPGKSGASSSSTTPTPHPSFPFMYNPMMFNPLFAQSLGNFSLPTGLPTSFASLVQAQAAGMTNGAGDSEIEEGEIVRPRMPVASLSDAEEGEIVPQDLSVKRRPAPAPVPDLDDDDSNTAQDLSMSSRQKRELSSTADTHSKVDNTHDMDDEEDLDTIESDSEMKDEET